MASAQLVWELSRAFLADRPGDVAVLKAYLDESGVHDGSPVLTVAAYTAKPKTWRDWTRTWNAAKRPIRVYHAADAANLSGEFEGWEKPAMNALAARLLPVIADAEIAGVVAGIHLGEFEKATKDRPDLRGLIGHPYGACFHWLVGQIVRLQNKLGSAERIAFVHENNDHQGHALESFDWIKQNVNFGDRAISLSFGTKADYVPLQAADILAYEANKRLRDPSKPERRAWAALKPKQNVMVGYFGKDNMPWLLETLAEMQQANPRLSVAGQTGPYWARLP